jgi:hypothetical protein
MPRKKPSKETVKVIRKAVGANKPKRGTPKGKGYKRA